MNEESVTVIADFTVAEYRSIYFQVLSCLISLKKLLKSCLPPLVKYNIKHIFNFHHLRTLSES